METDLCNINFQKSNLSLTETSEYCKLTLHIHAGPTSHIPGGPKSKPLPNYQKIVFVKLKYQSSTIILSVGIKYSLPDLLFYFNNYASPAK